VCHFRENWHVSAFFTKMRGPLCAKIYRQNIDNWHNHGYDDRSGAATAITPLPFRAAAAEAP
jgi:hypothetical protein